MKRILFLSVAFMLLCSVFTFSDLVYEEGYEAIAPVQKALEAVVCVVQNNRVVGTGFIVHQEGFLVTNHHLIGSDTVANNTTIYTSDGEEYKVMYLFSTEIFDTAVVKILSDRKDFPFMEWANRRITLGEEVYSIGNPLGVVWSISKGIIAAVRVDTETLCKHIQIDVLTLGGSSGSPVVDKEGKVVGMVSWGLAFQASPYAPPVMTGLNFAIDANIIKIISNSVIRLFRYLTI
jgi:S1-C subfamily serine protease